MSEGSPAAYAEAQAKHDEEKRMAAQQQDKLPIRKWPDPALTQPNAEVVNFDAELQSLARRMWDLLYSVPGIGLAAPQVGINLRMAVLDTSVGKNQSDRYVICNPKIILESTTLQVASEGCLSMPGFKVQYMRRPNAVTIQYQDINGKEIEQTAEGLLAQAFCHETDHLNGILFFERLSPLHRDIMKRRVQKLMRKGKW